MLGAGLSAAVGKAMAALLAWLGLTLSHGWLIWEAAPTAFLPLWHQFVRRASRGETAPWSELPPELLGLVLSRLPSQFDRVRLGAVCRPWRSAPRLHPLPPPFPWIVLRDHTFLSLPDGALHRLPRHLCCGEVVVYRVSTGSTLFFCHADGRCCLLNPSSGKTTTLKINLADCSKFHKLVLSDHIVAFHTIDKLTIIPRQGGAHMTWVAPANIYYTSMSLTPHGIDVNVIVDIAVFQRNLYVLTRKYNNLRAQQPELHLLDINHEHNCVRSVRCISATPINDDLLNAAIGTRHLFFFYLVVSGDRLLMVERQIDAELPNSTHDNPRSRPIRAMFEVSEALDLIGGHGRWSKVDTLMGRALFVGRECSQSLPSQCGARADCIYFMTERKRLLPRVERMPGDDLLDCVMYNLRDGKMEPLAWEVEAARNGPSHPTWLFPADV